MPEPSPPPGALADLRVVEFAQALAVPYCGKILGDLGATVTKIEPPRGDTYRLQGRTHVPHEGREFPINNRGKRSVCLDFTKPEARTVIDALVRDADVVLVSMKGTDLPRFGLDYETLRAVNEQVVYLQNSPYGSEGPLATEGGYDVVAMGLAGMSALLAAPDDSGDAPLMVRPALADIVTGMLAASGSSPPFVIAIEQGRGSESRHRCSTPHSGCCPTCSSATRISMAHRWTGSPDIWPTSERTAPGSPNSRPR